MTTRIIFLATLLCALVACESSEDQSRMLLNRAISAWDAGQLQSAADLFDQIERDHLSTTAATEALRERKHRLEVYRKHHSKEANLSRNSDKLGRDLLQAIDSLFERNGAYPQRLQELELKEEYYAFLTQCDYSAALWNSGYYLDCSNADAAYADHLDKQRVEKLAKVRKRRYARSRSSALTSKEPAILSPSEFPAANKTWGESLNPTGYVPVEQFYAAYINTNYPKAIVHSEIVPGARISYSYDAFKGIKSQDFGAYWVGTFVLQAPEVRRFSISQSWSKARLIIDGHIVYEGGSNASTLVRLGAGNHKIEVEYINNWHTTKFSMTMGSEVITYNNAQVRDRLKNNIQSDYDVLYAGVYESASKDLSVILNVGKSAKPVVLVLSSYGAVQWRVSNPFETDVRAIVYGSHSPGSLVKGDVGETVLQYPLKNSIGSYRFSSKCTCTAGIFHCEDGDALSTISAVKKLTGHTLEGLSGKYSTTSLSIPEVVVTDHYIEDAEAQRREIASSRSQCRKKNSPNFETMLN